MSMALPKVRHLPRSDVGFKTKTTPTGNIETPIAALELALASGATFCSAGLFSPAAAAGRSDRRSRTSRGFFLRECVQPLRNF